MQQPYDTQDDSGKETGGLVLALILSGVVLFLWQHFYAAPREQAMRQQQAELAKQEQALQKSKEAGAIIPEISSVDSSGGVVYPSANNPVLSREEALSKTRRIAIRTGELEGSISLRGGRIDDIVLRNYREELNKDSPKVVLLSPKGTESPYFIDTGWVSADKNMAVPSADTEWEVSGDVLTPDSPIVLRWDNGAGVTFEKEISVDDFAMFTVRQRIRNNSDKTVKLAPYGMINRVYNSDKTAFMILHEGLIGTTSGELEEFTYSDMKKDNLKKTEKNATGWLGITDKYWLTALIPAGNVSDALGVVGQDTRFKANYRYYALNNKDYYQADYLGTLHVVPSGEQAAYVTHIFAGAKKLGKLDEYSKKYNIPLFDRAVDFGVLYFLTRPLFLALSFLYHLLGNFGLAILALTVIVKILLFPLANKSYKSMGQMRKLMPKMTEIREKYADDRIEMNRRIMELYKKEKVNPGAGCLPMLIQIPIFFALYKVLFVTIEMRHAPFYGWLQDLSAKDPSNIFTLFGLIDWNPPSFLHLGVLPILMLITMLIQQRLNPTPPDPSQAFIMKIMPWIFLPLFASFPAGLVLYWVWSNILTIIQQWIIMKRHGLHE